MIRRHTRRFIVEIEQEPKSKKISSVEAITFQKAVLERLRELRSRAMTGDLFLQLEFSTTSKTPPSIYTLPKNYLDQLIPRGVSKIDRKNLLYKDDRQVKALVVKYRLGTSDEKPSIRVQAEPMRHFLDDIQLIEQICSDDFVKDDGDRWHGHVVDALERGPFDTIEFFGEGRIEELLEFEHDKARFISRFGDDTYEACRDMLRRLAQQEVLQRTDSFICRGVLSAFQDFARKKGRLEDPSFMKFSATPRDMIFDSPFVLPLHHSPHRSGDSEAFDKFLRKMLSDYKDNYPFMFPLNSEMCVTILMVPPENGGKDLDNLARLILPALHQIWMPPSHAAHRIKLDRIHDEKIRSYWEQLQNGLPKEPKISITEYRAFELPRLPDAPKDGLVWLGVGDGQMPINFREKIDSYLRTWRDDVGR